MKSSSKQAQLSWRSAQKFLCLVKRLVESNERVIWAQIFPSYFQDILKLLQSYCLDIL